MPADVIRLADRRARTDEDISRAPLALTAHMGAVSMSVGSEDGTEWWFSPEQAEELGQDLIRMAREARGK